MIDVQKYNRLKEINKKYGYGSWALWPPKDNSEEGDAKNKDVSFFDEEEKNGTLFDKLTDKVMMLALNPSGDANSPIPPLWKNFRGGMYDQRISMLVNKYKKYGWEGCYITDLFKKRLGTKSDEVGENSRNWTENDWKKNTEPFVEELNAIGLDNLKQIIVFGSTSTFKYLKKIVKMGILPQEVLKKTVKINHYSYNWKESRRDKGYINKVCEQLKKQKI